MGHGGTAPFVVGVGGSTNPGSMTSRLLRAALDRAAERGWRTEAFTGSALADFPMYAPPFEDVPAAARSFVEAVRRADAVVIASPGYHGAMSGMVKNAIDYLEALRDDARPYLDGRPVGIIVVAAGWQACGTTLTSARSAVHALRGWPTPFGVTVNSAEQKADDERVAGALTILVDQLTHFVTRGQPTNPRRD